MSQTSFGRKGPRLNPDSARSDARGIRLRALPAEGCTIKAPRWPQPVERDEQGKETEQSRRARKAWREAWTTPQAVAWHEEPWRWPIVEEYCLVKAAMELAPAKSAALIGQLHKYRDQLGLTPGGLVDNLWRIENRPVVPVEALPTGKVLTGSRARYAAAVKAREEEAG